VLQADHNVQLTSSFPNTVWCTEYQTRGNAHTPSDAKPLNAYQCLSALLVFEFPLQDGYTENLMEAIQFTIITDNVTLTFTQKKFMKMPDARFQSGD
jgi:hypothetical protein